MLRSMTGFGSGRASVAGEELTVEVKSVNHKFCEVKVRLPRELSALEPVLVKAVKDRIFRGAVDVTVRWDSARATTAVARVDTALAQEYRQAYRALADAIGARDEVPLTAVATMPGVIRMEERAVELDSASQSAGQALDQALSALLEMRVKEGAAVEADFRGRLELIERLSSQIGALSPSALAEYRTRLSQRIADLAAGVTLDPQRLAQEVAILADRTDVTEELTRLSSHIGQFRALMAAREPTGRKMDFLVQEMHREVNTTGSKSQYAAISERVVALKVEIERLREQVQNIE